MTYIYLLCHKWNLFLLDWTCLKSLWGSVLMTWFCSEGTAVLMHVGVVRKVHLHVHRNRNFLADWHANWSLSHPLFRQIHNLPSLQLGDPSFLTWRVARLVIVGWSPRKKERNIHSTKTESLWVLYFFSTMQTFISALFFLLCVSSSWKRQVT